VSAPVVICAYAEQLGEGAEWNFDIDADRRGLGLLGVK